MSFNWQTLEARLGWPFRRQAPLTVAAVSLADGSPELEPCRLTRLMEAIEGLAEHEEFGQRTRKLLRAGRAKIGQKLVEEAAEVALDGLAGDPSAVIRESADLLYHLTVLWSARGITLPQIWAELDRRERLYGLAEKQAKSGRAMRD